MKAGELHILLHHHLSSAPYPESSTFYRATLAMLREQGLLNNRNETTDKGRSFIETLKAVEPVATTSRHVTQMRTLKPPYMAVASVVAGDRYLDMSEGQFVGAVMKESQGAANPENVRQIYHDLIDEAFSPATQQRMREERDLGSNSGSSTPGI